jgi:hypothetical protein
MKCADIFKELKESNLRYKLIEMVYPNPDKNLTELNYEDVVKIRIFYKMLVLYSLLIDFLNIAKKIHIDTPEPYMDMEKAFKSVLGRYLECYLGERWADEMNEKFKKGEVNLENVFELLALAYKTGGVLAYRLIVALERLNDAVRSGNREAVLKAIGQLNELFEQFINIYQEQIKNEEHKDPSKFWKVTEYGFWIF